MNTRNFLAFVGAALAASACGSGYSTNSAQSTTYVSVMNGANERPATTSTGQGTATYTLTGKTITYVITVSSALTGPALASHIHGPASTSVSTGVIVPFATNNVSVGTVAQGTIDLNFPISNGGSSVISGDSLLALFNAGLAYTNVHTQAFGGGEIRGQIVKQ